MFLRNLLSVVLPRGFLHVLFRWFGGLWDSLNMWIYLSERCSDFSSEFSWFQVWYVCEKSIVNLSSYSSNSYTTVFVILGLPFLAKEGMQSFVFFATTFCLLAAMHNRRSMSSNFLAFQTLGNISWRSEGFLLLIIFQYCSSLISNWLLIIL